MTQNILRDVGCLENPGGSFMPQCPGGAQQAAQRDYGTTGCGCTLPGDLCVEQRLMQYFFIFTALLEIQCLHHDRFFFCLVCIAYWKFSGSLKAHSSLRPADRSSDSCPLCFRLHGSIVMNMNNKTVLQY